MTATSPIRKDIVPIIITLLLVNFLFWADEGYYDFRWMRNGGNWFFFLVYTGCILAGQIFVKDVFLKKVKEKYQTPLTILAGIPLGLILVISAIISIGLIVRLVA